MNQIIERAPLLIELGSEELPPKDLPKLSKSFAENIEKGLQEANLNPEAMTIFSTPRRLAVRFQAVDSGQQDQEVQRRGPSLKSAYDAEGKPTPAALGFAKSVGTDFNALQTIETDKGECLGFTQFLEGESLDNLISPIIHQAMKALPISKRMRWGHGDYEFVRPVHWLVALLGDKVLDVEVFSIKSSRESQGHRIHHPEPVVIKTPSDYPDAMRKACVIVDTAERQKVILEQIDEISKENKALANVSQSLLDEVTGLVEWPVALCGVFNEDFLQIPHEVLTISMETHQRYFSMRDADSGTYLNKFITIANLESLDPTVVIKGNQRVIEPRFADAEFFWQQDQKNPLESYLPKLNKVVFHKDIGTQGERIARITKISERLAQELGVDINQTKRIATLSKCDLLTDMVQEFPELQGTMGKYYAQRQGETDIVSQGIEAHYSPRFAGDTLPTSIEATCVSISEKLDTIVSLFSIEQYPTGSKDPYALRRAALGVIRMIIEGAHSIDLKLLVSEAIAALPDNLRCQHQELQESVVSFILERYKHYAQANYDSEQIASVLSSGKPSKLYLSELRLKALNNPAIQEEIFRISAAAKRARNLLSEHSIEGNTALTALFEHPTEHELHEALAAAEPQLKSQRAKGDYDAILSTLSGIAPKIDAFFEAVMINADDAKIQTNRLMLLQNFLRLTEADYTLSQLTP